MYSVRRHALPSYVHLLSPFSTHPSLPHIMHHPSAVSFGEYLGVGVICCAGAASA